MSISDCCGQSSLLVSSYSRDFSSFIDSAAACCSASFLDVPEPDPVISPAVLTTTLKVFSWSGPASETTS